MDNTRNIIINYYVGIDISKYFICYYYELLRDPNIGNLDGFFVVHFNRRCHQLRDGGLLPCSLRGIHKYHSNLRQIMYLYISNAYQSLNEFSLVFLFIKTFLSHFYFVNTLVSILRPYIVEHSHCWYMIRFIYNAPLNRYTSHFTYKIEFGTNTTQYRYSTNVKLIQ